MMATPVFPWDGRDQEDQAEAYYNAPLRDLNKRLDDENMRLKRLLREHGISWSPLAIFPPGASTNVPASSARGREKREQLSQRQTRSLSAAATEQRKRLPHLPMEVQLRILQYAMTSDYPIIDPLSKSIPENQTVSENHRKNEIAIHALAACRAFHAEGTRILWTCNQFIFTTHHALRNFSSLPLTTRRHVKHITLRVIAKFYDDQQRPHLMSRDYHPDLRRDVPLRVVQRVRDSNLTRKGFRCYTWCQTIDFLDALRPPFDPKHNKKEPRLRLLPCLESMRIDFVNFPEYFLPYSETDLHEMASHDLGCTLNELVVTGLPCCEVGMKAGSELCGLLKDDGLFLDGGAAFYQTKTALKPLPGRGFACKAIRTWRRLLKESTDETSHPAVKAHDHGAPEIPPVPEEEGHPPTLHKKRKILWKKVPISRDAVEREWMEFDRRSGLPIDEITAMWGDESDLDTDDDMHICAKCGEVHDAYDSDGF